MIFRDKFYPWLKSIFGKKKSDRGTEGVYAGPEAFDVKPDPDAETGPVGEVYAGPEFFEKDPGEPETPDDKPDLEGSVPDRPAAVVYAGPEYFKDEIKSSDQIKNGPDGSEASGDKPDFQGSVPNRPAAVVYAGPEYFKDEIKSSDQIKNGPDGSEEAENGTEETNADEDGRPVKALYAAPEFLERQQPPVMCVYAGPEYFAPPCDGDGGQFAPAPEPEEGGEENADGENGPRCPACGASVPEDAPFCHECGTPLKKDE